MLYNVKKTHKGVKRIMNTTEWEKLYKECDECRSCSLCETKTNTVFGSGNQNADIMFIGEAPGENEDLQGLPFVGASGRLLDKYLDAVGLKREDVYIANILKCRPPKNRDPKPEEEDACIGFLRRQLELIHPKLIVCLGRISAMRIIKPDFKITVEHGKWFKKGDYLICAVYHPSALLRDPRKRDDMMRDFVMLKEKLSELNG